MAAVFHIAGVIIIAFAAMSDYKTKLVPRIYWPPAITAFIISAALSGRIGTLTTKYLYLYLLLQLVLFSRLYGFADCKAFFACAVSLTILFGDRDCLPELYFAHMTVAYLFLIFVQVIKKNVRKLRLIEEKPFIPYILAAYFFILFFFSIFYPCAIL